MASSGHLLNNLLSHSHKQMQKKSSKLMQEAEKTGLKINIQKTKLLRVNSTQHAKVQLKGKDIEEDNKFTYLGTFINKCLRYILKTKWQDKTTNKEIWRRSDQHSIRKEIARIKWTWNGYTLRKQTNNVTRWDAGNICRSC